MTYFSTATRHRAIRARSPEGLDDATIAQYAPSVFATEAHESRSDRFAYVSTAQILAGMRQEGFVPMFVTQGRSRIEGKTEFTKHMIRFQHRSTQAPAVRHVGQLSAEVVLVNAHDGTSTYQANAGLFRLVCLNGMTMAEGPQTAIRVPHTGDALGKVIEGSYEVLKTAGTAVARAGDWAGINLSGPEQMALAEAAHTIRFAESDGTVNTPITAQQLLHVRRSDDAGANLWQTFNRVQENVVRGGLTGWARGENGRRRRVTTKPVQSIDGDLRLNRALWQLAERMAQLKAG